MLNTIKGGSRRAEKSRKVLMMMMKVAKLRWAGPAGQEQGGSKAKVGLKHEQGRALVKIHYSNSRRPFKYILCWYLPNVAPHNKFHQNQMKKTKVELIQYWSTLVGQSGWSKNSRSPFKNILCCSFPNVTPYNKFHLNRMKNTEVQIFDILEK